MAMEKPRRGVMNETPGVFQYRNLAGVHEENGEMLNDGLYDL
jgi:hypothetical protein